MTIHRKGAKADRDRAVLINSYKVMVKDFRIPRKDWLDQAALSRLSNEMLFKINKDIYSQATVKQAKKLAIKMGLLDKPESWIGRKVRHIRSWFKYLFHKPRIIRPTEYKEAANG
jgi:hypothetical protein